MAQKFHQIPQWAFSTAARSTLKLGPRLRRHSRDQLNRLVRSIESFGIPVPIVVDANNIVIDGHLVLKAARKLGLGEVPVARLEQLSDEQARALRIALNRLSEMGAWDEENLTLELAKLATFDFDIGLTGFSTPEIDTLFLASAQPEETAEVPSADGLTVTRPGDSCWCGRPPCGINVPE